MSTYEEERKRATHLKHLASTFVSEAGILNPPVDPLIWCQTDEIVVHENDLHNECDGLLVYKEGKFHLFYRPVPTRYRFTIAHELGHYLIDEHHKKLRSNSYITACKTEFLSDSSMEREADAFASGLLMPDFLFEKKCPDPNFNDIAKVAKIFEVSMASCLLRTLDFTSVPTVVVVTEGGKIKWYSSSYGMVSSGVYGIKTGSPPPTGSRTAKIWPEISNVPSEPVNGGKCDASDWFISSRDQELWEEVLPRPYYNQTMTLLTLIDD